MQAFEILPQEQIFPATTPPPEVCDDLEAQTPEEEYEAWLGEQAVWEAYFADKGVRS